VTRSRILLATRSAGKLRELRPLFERHGLDVLDLGNAGIPEAPEEEAIEAFPSFEENALAKARWFFAASGGRATLADDSGLEVDALGGQPGVHSKRWSGRSDLHGQALDDANNARLLREMGTAADRSARYVCAAAYVDGERELVVRGETRGTVLSEPRGSGGFGYDPYFLSDDLGVSFGEATREAKERVSHRGRAFTALLEQLGRAWRRGCGISGACR
jgi:XTP/dITP diphosphohydrolase